MRRSFARPTRATTALVISILVLWTLAPAVSADDGLEVTTPFPAVAVAPGTKVSFDLTVDSTRTANVALALSGVPEGWTASLLGGGFVVDGGGRHLGHGRGGPARCRRPGGCSSRHLDDPGDRPRRRSPGRAADLRPGRRRGCRRHHADDVHADPDRRIGRDLHLRPAAPERHGPGRDGVRLGERAGGLGRRGHADRRDAGRVDGRRGRRHARTSRSRPTPRTTSRPAPIPIKVEAHAGERTIPAELGIEVTGSYSMTLATPNDVLSASGSAGSPTTQAFEITNTGTAPITEVDAHRDPADELGGHDRPAHGRIDRARRHAGVHRHDHALGRGGRRRLRHHVRRRRGRGGRRGQQPGPLHGRDLAALGARRPGPHRPDPRRPVLRLPDLRAPMSASPGRIAPKRRPGRRLAAAPTAPSGGASGIDAPSDTHPHPHAWPDQALRRPRRGRSPRSRHPRRGDLRAARARTGPARPRRSSCCSA